MLRYKIYTWQSLFFHCPSSQKPQIYLRWPKAIIEDNGHAHDFRSLTFGHVRTNLLANLRYASGETRSIRYKALLCNCPDAKRSFASPKVKAIQVQIYDLHRVITKLCFVSDRSDTKQSFVIALMHFAPKGHDRSPEVMQEDL